MLWNGRPHATQSIMRADCTEMVLKTIEQPEHMLINTSGGNTRLRCIFKLGSELRGYPSKWTGHGTRCLKYPSATRDEGCGPPTKSKDKTSPQGGWYDTFRCRVKERLLPPEDSSRLPDGGLGHYHSRCSRIGL